MNWTKKWSAPQMLTFLYNIWSAFKNSAFLNIYSTVTDLARFLGLSTSNPLNLDI